MAKRRKLNKDRVLATAVELADESGGMGELTLTALANALDVRVPSLYNHIDGLDGLHDELSLLAGQMLLERIRQATFGKTGREALWAMAHAYRTFAHEQPALYPLTIVAPDPDQVRRTAVAQEWLQMLLLTMASLGLREEEALHAIRAFRSLLHGFVSLEAAGGFKMDLDVNESFDFLLKNLLNSIDQESTCFPTDS
jgi:AcrR family transcriptional regulator